MMMMMAMLVRIAEQDDASARMERTATHAQQATTQLAESSREYRSITQAMQRSQEG